MKSFEVHPAANIFPMMTEEELSGLVDDIRDNGQREPAVLWNGLLVDGRNRASACERLKIELDVAELDPETDPVKWVVSYNLHRRHLTTSQRAMCAAKFATLKHGSNQHKAKKEETPNGASTIQDAAKLFGVGTGSIDRAKQVIEHGAKEVIEATERGEITVSLANKFVSEVTDKREQKAVAKEGSTAIRDAVTPPKNNVAPKKQSSVSLPKEPDAEDLAEVSAWIARHDKRPAIQRFISMWSGLNAVQQAAIRAHVLDSDT